MSFGWLGTFRQGSWRSFRSFVLTERKDAARRIAVIEAELARIGEVIVFYGSTTDDDGNTVVSEERKGIAVTNGTSLQKLLQAYIASGGNPLDISMFLTPDTTLIMPDNANGVQTQPYGGVVYPQNGAYAPSGQYTGGYMTLNKYLPRRVGTRAVQDDSTVAFYVDLGRRWVNQIIKERRNDLEARIIKLCDLREQLLQELEDITTAVGGASPDVPAPSSELFDPDLTVARIVDSIDSFFYTKDDTNTPDFTTENTDALKYAPFLISDILPDEDNTAL